MLTLFVRPLLVAVVLLPFAVRAVTLGEARVKSYLNQPLDAEIEVIGLAPGQQEDIRLRLANQAQFDRLGIVYQNYLNDLEFDIVGTDGNWIVRARSRRPITEPFIDFPLQMSWRGGQMIRQYTLLLDPPTVIRTATRTARPDIGRSAAAQPPAPTAQASVGSSYGPVQRGETLWPIAQQLRPAGITTRQMAMALLRANPQAFIDGNINKLRAGAVLRIPPRSFVEQLDAATARREFAAQTQRRQPQVSASPRQLPAVATPAPAAVAAAPAAAAVASGQSGSADPQLRIVTEEPTPRGENQDGQSLNDRLLVTMEEIESNRITTNAIESRLARLEDELSRMQQLVELKDAQIAALQSEVKAREAIAQAAQAAAAAAGTSPTIASQAPLPAVTPAPAPAAAIAAEPIMPVPAQDPQPWYRPHLWVIWAILGLLGLTALLMMFRRQQATNPDLLMSDLPATEGAASAPYAAKAQPAPAAHAVAEPEPPTGAEPRPLEAAPPVSSVPDRAADAGAAVSEDSTQAADVEQQIEGLTNSLLDEMLEEHKHLDQRPAPAADTSALETELSDEDIASWVEDLDFEVSTAPSAADTSDAERPVADDDIPGILTELDDQLSASDTTLTREPAPIELDPVDEISEDDAFSMSLDLARAYLEIGDQEGARDMLKQALSGARDPEHRRQIEELLQHID